MDNSNNSENMPTPSTLDGEEEVQVADRSEFEALEKNRLAKAQKRADKLMESELKKKALGKKRHMDYEYLEGLGTGAYGRVVKAQDKENGEVFAAKIVDKAFVIKNKVIHQVKNERDVLLSLDHPNIIKLFNTFQTPSELYYIMEFAPNGELQNHLSRLGSFSLPCIKSFSAQIVNGLEHMHSREIIHRDIKPENLLLNGENIIKIIDFGTAKKWGDLPRESESESENRFETRKSTFVGTAQYVAPEIVKDNQVCFASDFWALGCTIFAMFSNNTPFNKSSQYLIFQSILNDTYTFPSYIPSTAQDLISRFLEKDPSKRLGHSLESIGNDVKSHPFFEGIDWDNISSFSGVDEISKYPDAPDPVVDDSSSDDEWG